LARMLIGSQVKCTVEGTLKTGMNNSVSKPHQAGHIGQFGNNHGMESDINYAFGSPIFHRF